MLSMNGIIRTNVPAMFEHPGTRLLHGGATMFNIISQKRCAKCKLWKNRDAFGKDIRKTDGLRSYCKKCHNDESRNYRNNNPERAKEISRRANQKYRKIHPEKRLASVYKWVSRNTEKVRAAQKKWRSCNPEKIKEYRRKSYSENPESHRANFRRWYEENKDKARSIRRKWLEVNPEKSREYNRNRYARHKNANGKIKASEWNALKEKYNYMCLSCKKKEPEIKLTLDHVIPLVLGGDNSIENAQPLCASCNSSKNKKHIDYRSSK